MLFYCFAIPLRLFCLARATHGRTSHQQYFGIWENSKNYIIRIHYYTLDKETPIDKEAPKFGISK